MQMQVNKKIAGWTLLLLGGKKKQNSFSATLCSYSNDDLIIYDKKLTPEVQNHQ